MRTIAVLFAGVVFLAIACGASAAEPTGHPWVPAGADTELGACPKHVRPQRLRCGELEEPYERADPSLGTTSVRFAVREPGDREHDLGTIVAIEGGPGYGSIASARYYIHMLGPLLERRRLLLVDMRGTGHSRPIDCPALQEGRGSDLHGVARCAHTLGARYASYRTAAAADDIEDVRRHLGLGTLDVYGDSYGTYLAQSYAFRHGASVDALVLDSAYPLRGESGWYPSLPRTGIRSLAISCRRNLVCHGSARTRLARIVSLLRATPRGPGPLLDAIGAGGYSPPGSYLDIDRAIRAYLDGNKGPYRRLTAPVPGGYGSPRSYSRGLELAVSCNDYPMLWDKSAGDRARRRQLERAIRTYPRDRFAPFTPREVALEAFSGYRECLGWPPPSPFYEPPAPPGAAPPTMPTLVIAGELDDVTSPTEARMVAAEFADSRLEIVRNAGHVSSLYGGRYPSRDRVREFLVRHGGS